MQFVPTLTSEDAEDMLAAASEAAQANRAAVTMAVVDAAGVILAVRRMDGARGFSVDLASRKARTAAMIGVSTAVLAQMYRERPAPPDLMTMPGGLPVLAGGKSAGAIGVSGGSAELDELVAAAGVQAVAAADPA